MGWLIALAVIVLLAILPLGASVLYDEDGPRVRILAGPLKIQVFPLKKKKKQDKPRKAKSQKQKKPKKAAAETAPAEKPNPAPKPKSGGSWTDFLPLVRIALDLLNDLRRKLRVDHLKLHLTMAADDPCDLAVNYGKAWAAVGNLMPQLERVFVIQKRNIEVECDFTADKTLVIARLDLTITLGRILGLVFLLIGRAIVELIKIVLKRKGGAVHEPKSS